MIQCYVKRTKLKGCLPGTKSGARYELFLKDNDQLLASAEKGANDTSYALFKPGSSSHLDSERVGKLKANISHTEFSLVDHGFNANNRSVWDDDRDKLDSGELDARRELCAVSVSTSMTGGRRLSVTSNQFKLVSKQPVWDADAKQKKLEFNGRVTLPSVKNFQLVSQEVSTECVPDTPRGGVKMMFGRVGKDAFNLDYSAPLSGVQAFGIALSIFGAKR